MLPTCDENQPFTEPSPRLSVNQPSFYEPFTEPCLPPLTVAEQELEALRQALRQAEEDEHMRIEAELANRRKEGMEKFQARGSNDFLNLIATPAPQRAPRSERSRSRTTAGAQTPCTIDKENAPQQFSRAKHVLLPHKEPRSSETEPDDDHVATMCSTTLSGCVLLLVAAAAGGARSTEYWA